WMVCPLSSLILANSSKRPKLGGKACKMKVIAHMLKNGEHDLDLLLKRLIGLRICVNCLENNPLVRQKSAFGRRSY
nr:hypothetical protein [Thermoproteota archaeon]